MTAPASRHQIPAARYGERLAAAQAIAARRGVTGLLVGAGADLRYLTGYAAMLLERLTMLVLPVTGRPTLIAPRLEAMRAAASPAAAAGLVDLVAWEETDDPHAIAAGRLPRPETPGGRVLVSSGLWAMHVLALQRALPGFEFGLATEVLGELRMVKDPDEIVLLRLAAAAADRALAGIAAGPLVGRTEADVSHEIRDLLVAEGHDETSFAIVGSGPNSASPHHEPGERLIEPGEPIVLDIGGLLGGYASDVTRTVWVGGPDGEHPPDPFFLQVHELVRRAHDAASAAVRPGVACRDLDAVARDVIDAAGFGQAFLHRLGHGIGLEGHEEPYLVAGNPEPLRAGMAFSIEPGVYLEGRFGVRIEDIVVCGAAGADALNRLRHDPWIVSG